MDGTLPERIPSQARVPLFAFAFELSKPNYQKQVQNPILPGQCALHEAVKRLPRFSPVLCFPFRRIGADRMGYLVPSFVLQKQRIKN